MVPAATNGLYDSKFEHDACGVGFVADLSARGGHDVVASALRVLCNLEHRGAAGAEPDTGDGAGILTQVPHEFFTAVTGLALPDAGGYAAGLAFLPTDEAERRIATAAIADIAEDEGLAILGWRDVPVELTACGPSARAAMPHMAQLFVAGQSGETGLDLERMAFCLRKRADHESRVYFASLSVRTIVYKGMLSAPQVEPFFPDLTDERYHSNLAMVHSRFSTNTFPSWERAHPYRYIAHNGEINTVQGNRNWMRAREAMLDSALIPKSKSGKGIERLFPIVHPKGSDSGSFDEALELLHLGGRSLPHALLMMIPEPWENHEEMDAQRRAFYEFHATMMEPWDGPALIAFTDGDVIGAVLDRNGLRPGRYWVTSDGLVILASEVGVLDVDPERVVRRGRLQPGRIFLADTAAGRIVEDEEVKTALAAEHPYQEWLDGGLINLNELPARNRIVPTAEDLLENLRTFGYTEEEVRVILSPMAKTGAEPIGSMGTDTPVAVLSDRPRLVYDYFTQLFAQVTNPPLDAIREELVTSLSRTFGPQTNLLEPTPAAARQIVLPFPVIGEQDLARLVHVNHDNNLREFAAHTIDGLFDPRGGGVGLQERLQEICTEASNAIADGARLIVLSDRGAGGNLIPIPSLLLTGAVHHHLIREKSRTRVGLIVETGDARECHHIALLTGFGAAAICPYMAIECVRALADRDQLAGADGRSITPDQAEKNLIKALGKGVLKIMSKMGVSTVSSYTGAQIFEAVGLSDEVIEGCFTGTTSRIGGVGFDALAEEAARRAATAAGGAGFAHRRLEIGGEYQWRREGEPHLFNPETVFKLQHATSTRRYDIFKEYTKLVDDQAEELHTLRGLLRIKGIDEPGQTAPDAGLDIDEIEPVTSIVRRFSTGAMSYGSISAEAHETLAIAMNRLGGRSNTGEGGEDPARFTPDANGDLRRSAIKQVASGRFGVTSEYLVNADDIQIKMAQGAKPGEGGQLPGYKIYPWIAKTRSSTPGVGLISPPPHHDIYSIEDLAQLIHDLKNANPAARVHVKLVAEAGVGTVAAGVSKAHADVVLISGHDGGTGAAPLTSLKHAGGPWEIGLAETQQTLLKNRLRDRIVVQVDGQLKTGRDVVIAALLGAEEFGFASAPLVVSGCVMMRVCHLDTCPVGIATQNPVLRERYSGRAEFVVNFFEFIAEEVREYLAALGLRSVDEAVGRVDLLETALAVEHWKASGLDLTPVLLAPEEDGPRRHVTGQDHGLDKALDNTLIQLAEGALEEGRPVHLDLPVRNVNRTVGTMLGYEVTKRWGSEGLPADTITVNFTGSAGQSFGAFVPKGVTLRLHGDANDYVGKGLSGGRLVIRPARESPFEAETQVIAGNVIGYGATGGEIFLRGVVGERFCVRNSGALAVTEGVGDHGCEYMTGGQAVVLGPTGRNFAAGMSGGVAYVLDLLSVRLNQEMVDVDPLDADDVTFLRDVVTRHHEETGSAVAASLLAHWQSAVQRFSKVMPRDYKRVLHAASAAEREGRDVNEAVMAASHG
jgi:glutamate synthase (NADPH/NADH) large chain